MANESHDAPLATWKTWWPHDLVDKLAESLREMVDVRQLPGGGLLVSDARPCAATLKDPHTANVVEALLRAYPGHRQPSGYLLGDTIMRLDRLWNHALLGAFDTHPLKEKARRERALMQGAQLKKLLSYTRTSALKTSYGRSAGTTFLKGLANERLKHCKKSTSPTSSPTSSTATGSPESAPSSCASSRIAQLDRGRL